MAVDAVEHDLGGADRATQQRGVQDVGREAGAGQQLGTARGFGEPLLVEVDIDPAGEQVLGVPLL